MDYLYEGFSRDPSWNQNPEPGYLDSTVADLRRLPHVLQADTVLVDVGEASWSRHLIEAALNALSALGCPLLHLYCLAYDANGHPHGIQQIENAGSLDEEVTRQRMVDSLVHIPSGERGYIVWEVTSLEASGRG